MQGELLNLNLKIYPKYVVVVDNSNCTVRIGGACSLWEVCHSSNYSGGFYNLKNSFGYTIYNYNQSIFRAATQKEIDEWLKKNEN